MQRTELHRPVNTRADRGPTVSCDETVLCAQWPPSLLPRARGRRQERGKADGTEGTVPGIVSQRQRPQREGTDETAEAGGRQRPGKVALGLQSPPREETPEEKGALASRARPALRLREDGRLTPSGRRWDRPAAPFQLSGARGASGRRHRRPGTGDRAKEGQGLVREGPPSPLPQTAPHLSAGLAGGARGTGRASNTAVSCVAGSF